jgi:hypothetical protein
MMSERKIRANRQNARRSTGPRTPEGKQTAAQNATTHGLLSSQVLLPGEDAVALDALRERLLADLRPVGELEAILADQVVVCAWKLRRVQLLEAGVFARGIKDELAAVAPDPTFGRAWVLAEALSTDGYQGDQFSKVMRYQAMWERALFRALHELQRLGAVRSGQAVAPPVAVDVQLSTAEMTDQWGRAGQGAITAGDVECGREGTSHLRNEATADGTSEARADTGDVIASGWEALRDPRRAAADPADASGHVERVLAVGEAAPRSASGVPLRNEATVATAEETAEEPSGHSADSRMSQSAARAAFG